MAKRGWRHLWRVLAMLALSGPLGAVAEPGEDACSPPSQPPAGGSAIARDLASLHATDDSSAPLPAQARARAISQCYRQRFAARLGDKAIAHTSDADLELLFQAANMAAFYQASVAHLNDMARLLDELNARGLVRASHVGDLHGAYVESRKFDRARQLAREYPQAGLQPLPQVLDASAAALQGPSVWTVSADERVLTREAVDLDVPGMIVVVAHPDCHFTVDALQAIDADPRLAGAFAQHAVWIVPPGRSLDFDRLQQWNRQHPESPMTLAVRSSDWPMIDQWATPTFYFFQDGRLQEKVVGWPGGKQRQKVVEALREINLLNSEIEHDDASKSSARDNDLT